jgi:AraC-like DNA-binding protein
VPSDLLVAVVAGRKVLHGSGRTVTAHQGQAVLISRGTQWDVVNDPYGQRQYEAWVLPFDDALVREFTPPTAERTQAVGSAQVVKLEDDLLSALQRTLPNEPSVSFALQRHRSLEVMLMLAEKGWSFSPIQEVSWTERIQWMVRQRPAQNWTVESLAKAFCMSESSLRRRLTGSTFTLAELVRNARLQVALGMLQTTDMSVGEVAQHCGWASHSRFTAAFQQRWNVVPSVVRSRMKESAQNLTDQG